MGNLPGLLILNNHKENRMTNIAPDAIADGLEGMKNVQVKIYDTAYSHGWYAEERSFGDRIALCHSELSEALEAFRDGDDMTQIRYLHTPNCGYFGQYTHGTDPLGACRCEPKPDGIAVELADTIIRILDMAEAESIPVLDAIRVKMAFNDTRPFRHGGKAL